MERTAQYVSVVTPSTLAMIQKSISKGLDVVEASLDLGLTTNVVQLRPEEISFVVPGEDEPIPFPQSFKEKNKVCYAIFGGRVFPLKLFSEETQLYYKLVPTSWRPILRISATPMHKKTFLDRLEREKVRGFVFDGGTGLGYSAIIASETASRVTTVEWDPYVLDMASYNPHSRVLFESPNIDLREGDITEEVLSFEDRFFDCVIQDGGTPKSSGEFFSAAHCGELYRVLRSGGRLFFYLPMHGRTKGRDFGAEHIQRLRDAGFRLQERDIEGSYAILYRP